MQLQQVAEARYHSNSAEGFLQRYFDMSDEDKEGGMHFQMWHPKKGNLVTVFFDDQGGQEFILQHIISVVEDGKGPEYEFWAAHHDDPLPENTTMEHLTVYKKIS